MISVENVSLNLANKLGDKLNKNDEEKAILKYGIFFVIHNALALFLTIIVGIVTGMLIEILTITIVCSSLKRYSGGVHSSSPERCLLSGILISLILSILCKYLVNMMSYRNLFVVIVVVLCYSYSILYKYCPVPSKNKPLKKESTRKKMRNKSFQLVSIYLFFIIIIYMVKDIHIGKTLIVSILLGITLQTTCLTFLGEILIKKLEKIFNIFKIK